MDGKKVKEKSSKEKGPSELRGAISSRWRMWYTA